MEKNNDKLFLLYAACIAANREHNNSFEECYCDAHDALEYYTEQEKFDGQLPNHIPFAKFDKAVRKFIADNFVNDSNGPYANGEVLRMFKHFNQPVIVSHELWTDGLADWEATVSLFLEHYLNKEHCRELYDYMHEQKLIDF